MPSLKAATHVANARNRAFKRYGELASHLYRRRICCSLNLAPPHGAALYHAVGVSSYILRLRCDRCDLFLLRGPLYFLDRTST